MKKKKEITTEHVRIYKSTHKRIKRMAFGADCTMAEAVDRLSKTGTVNKEKPIAKKKAMGILTHMAKTTVKVEKPENPSNYFKDRDGLYVWDNFRNQVVSGASTVKAGASFKLESFKLNRTAYDSEIEKSLRKNHIFTATDVCAILAELISKQSKGEEGTLLNNGYANLFYMESCVVGVRWGSECWGWRVGAWRRGDDRWSGGGRVFSPAI